MPTASKLNLDKPWPYACPPKGAHKGRPYDWRKMFANKTIIYAFATQSSNVLLPDE